MYAVDRDHVQIKHMKAMLRWLMTILRVQVKKGKRPSQYHPFPVIHDDIKQVTRSLVLFTHDRSAASFSAIFRRHHCVSYAHSSASLVRGIRERNPLKNKCDQTFGYSSYCKSTNSRRIFIFGLIILGQKFVAAEILFCKVQCDSAYRQQQYRPKICCSRNVF